MTGSVDFGGSDAAMNDEQMVQVDRGVHLVPATAGMVVWGLRGPEKGGSGQGFRHLEVADGQSFSDEFGFVPLPREVVSLGTQAVENIR